MSSRRYPRLMAISDAAARRSAGYADLRHWLDDLVKIGVPAVQLREKHLSGRELYGLAEQAVEHVAGAVEVWVNGRPDVAMAVGAHGVHLPSQGLPAARVSARFPDLRLGVACHSREEVTAATRDGACYVTFSPVFPSPGKHPKGLQALDGVDAWGTDVLALGGIEPCNAAKVLGLGAGLAAIRAFHDPVSGREMVEMARALASTP